jgi:hypothetical protein
MAIRGPHQSGENEKFTTYRLYYDPLTSDPVSLVFKRPIKGTLEFKRGRIGM